MALSRHRRTAARRRGLIMVVTLITLAVAAAVYYVRRVTVAVLSPAGPIASGERRLMIISFLLMLLVVVPVLFITFSFAWRYRASNSNKVYQPNWDHSRIAETIWWLIPSLLIAVLATITWFSSHTYDPYRAIASHNRPLRVQVVALQWRWLFVYPDLHIASINYLGLPTDTPVHFDITADAPMNSFWIPQLGGQVYAMPGMNTQLSLLAAHEGTYYGSSANVSGKGFANMHFKAEAMSPVTFNHWAQQVSTNAVLVAANYDTISKPTMDTRTHFYSAPTNDVYEHVLHKYMTMPDGQSSMEGM